METGHDLTPIALVMSLALIFGLLLNQIRLPAIVGYIFVGVALGPSGLGIIDNSEAVSTLAELGVLMLVFIIGMELNLRSFKSVYQTALLTVLLQIGLALAVMYLFATIFDLPTSTWIVLGFIVALSSTAVTFKMLEDVGEMHTDIGRLTIGILIAQDLAVVPMLLITTSLGGAEVPIYQIVLQVTLATGLLVVLAVYLSRHGAIRLPFTAELTRSAEIGTLAVLAVCFTTATVTGALGMSPALGAFVAGLLVGNSTMRRAANRTAIPIQSLLLVVFFLSIGLLIDFTYIRENLATVLSVLLFVAIAKTIANVAILQILRQPWGNAFQMGLLLTPVGEFSFVLAAAAAAAGSLDTDGYRLAVSVIALTLIISPIWYLTMRRFHDLTVTGISNARTALAAVYENEINAVDLAARTSRKAIARATTLSKQVVSPVVGRLANGGSSKTQRPEDSSSQPTPDQNDFTSGSADPAPEGPLPAPQDPDELKLERPEKPA